MNDNISNMNGHKRSAGMKRLLDELAEVNTKGASAAMVDNEMLSLMINEVLKGEDISKRYPAFYQKLLGDADMRQAFIDVLESIETEQAHQQIPLPNSGRASLNFLAGQPTRPSLEILARHKWRTTWQRTLEQIQALFSPSELAYRSDPGLFEDPWFTLLRDEIEVEGSAYAVALECTLAGNVNDVLSAYLNLAVTLGTTSDGPNFPLQASLQWGGYQESVLITEEGRARFPDIPLSKVLDETQQNVKSGLNLIVQTAS